jgi:threonine dehydrogenase-like Zn-dependent dehydrogenase
MPARILTHVAHQRCELLPFDPPQTGAGQLAGPTLATLVSPGTELNWAYCGNHFPQHSGYAAVFRVEQVGAEVTGWASGDLAFCYGGHQSWQCQAASGCHRLPAGLDPATATLARLMAVAHTSLITTRARPGQTVIVTGLGPVGLLAALQCRIAGYEVLACDPLAERRALASSAGLPTVETPPADFGAALALECSGHEAATIACCKAIRPCGEVVQIGTPWQKKTDLSAHELLSVVFKKYVYLRSGWEWELPPDRHHLSDVQTQADNVTTCLRWLCENRIPLPKGLIGHCDPVNCQTIYQGHLNRSLDHICSIFDWSAG